jgi:hypothetical protein
MKRFKLKARMIGLAMVLALTGMVGMTASVAVAGSTTAPRYGSHVTYYDCAGPYYGTQRLSYHCWADWDWYAEVFWGKTDWYVWVPAWYTA